MYQPVDKSDGVRQNGPSADMAQLTSPLDR